MLKTLSFLLALLALVSTAHAAQLDPSDANILGNILKSASGEQTVSFTRVGCRWQRLGATICTYEHSNGARDSFAWFKAAKAANILLKYAPQRQLANGLLEVSITNLACENDACSIN